MHFPTMACRIAAHPLKTVFLLALLVRLINLAFLTGNQSFFAETDAFAYWKLGAGLARPESFWSTLLAETDRMPLYPLLLGGIRHIFGDDPRMVAILQAVIDAGTCALIAALGALISPLVGLIAGILAALSVTLIVFSTQILTETASLFFFTLMLLAGARFLRHPTNTLAIIAGLAGGIASATRPAVAPLLAAAVPLVLVIALMQRRGFAEALAAALLFAVGAAAPIAPVLLRNVIHYGSFSLTTQTGHHLADWIVPLVTERADGTPYQKTVDRMEALYAQRAQTTLCAPRKLECSTEHDLTSPALLIDPRLRALPKPSFYNTPGASLWEKTRAYLFDDPAAYQVLLIVGLVAMLPILMLEAAGFVMLARTLPWAAVFAGGVLAYFLLLNGPVATPKYRLPMEPVLIVLAAIPLARLAERVLPRRSR